MQKIIKAGFPLMLVALLLVLPVTKVQNVAHAKSSTAIAIVRFIDGQDFYSEKLKKFFIEDGKIVIDLGNNTRAVISKAHGERYKDLSLKFKYFPTQERLNIYNDSELLARLNLRNTDFNLREFLEDLQIKYLTSELAYFKDLSSPYDLKRIKKDFVWLVKR